MKIAIGSDHIGFKLKQELQQFLKDQGYEVVDYGCFNEDAIDYPDVAYTVADAIHNAQAERGILICGTGIGVAVAACKYPGIRAALTHDTYSAERAQLSNNAQIITMGAQVIGIEAAKKVALAYLHANWAGGSQKKVDKITEIEQKFNAQLLVESKNDSSCSS